jgi:phosphatidylserine decarboxylase
MKIVFLLFILNVLSAASKNIIKYPKVVEQLQNVLISNPELSTSVLYTLKNVPQSDWAHGTTLDDLYLFFTSWLSALVVPSNSSLTISTTTDNKLTFITPNPLTYISPMWSLASETSNSVWVRNPELITWLQTFIQSRGSFMDSKESWNQHIESEWWMRVNKTEYKIPTDGFQTFNDFFTREIIEEYRPVDRDINAVVAPADGYTWVTSNNITIGDNFNLKADHLSPDELVGYNSIANQKYIGGIAVINFLSATDFHHFWSPVDGKIVAVEQLGGLYVANGNPCCVGDHRRAYIIIDTGKNQLGLVSVIAVGMYDISSIVLNATNIEVGKNIKKGAEMGYFQYGGSEMITLFEEGRIIVDVDVASAHGSSRKVGEKYAVKK